MKITFYGTRGSIPAPSNRRRKTDEFGGNTTCLFVESSDGALHIIDAGTGIRELGLDLLKHYGFDGKTHARANIFITHTHWDHIQGIPFFVPAYIPGNDIQIYGDAKINLKGNFGTAIEKHSDAPGASFNVLNIADIGLKRVLENQQNPRNFPASLDALKGVTACNDFIPDNGPIYKTTNLEINASLFNHPGGSISYRFTETKPDGSKVTFVFSTDFEPHDDYNDKVISLWKNADLVIADAQYEPRDSKANCNPFMPGWGHSDFVTDIELAKQADAKILALTHHEPKMDDSYHVGLEQRAGEYASATGSRLEKVLLARELEVIEI